jgi:hypothetical protein
MPTNYVRRGGVNVPVAAHIRRGGATVPATDFFPWNGQVSPPPDRYTVAEMLAEPGGFYWAHRGGSLDYAEMTMYAYQQAASHGFKCHEVSLARTSDGVWYGNHDDTMDRVTGGTLTGLAEDYTWAQTNAHQVAVPVGGGGVPQPFMRLDEWVAQFGDTHVLIFDPKNFWQNEDELLDYLQSVMPNDQLIGKAWGAGEGFANKVTARGIDMWGYYYASDIDSGAFATYQHAYTMLGLEVNDAQSYWDTVNAEGKPVVAHLIGSTADRDLAVSKGAEGFQTTRPSAVGPAAG